MTSADEREERELDRSVHDTGSLSDGQARALRRAENLPASDKKGKALAPRGATVVRLRKRKPRPHSTLKLPKRGLREGTADARPWDDEPETQSH